MSVRVVIGCGYLGRRVADLWHRHGDTVYALTRSTARADEMRRDGLQPIVGDVLDAPSLEVIPKADTVLYAVGFDRSAGPSKREVYVDGLANVLSSPAGHAKRFVYISSTSVYGQSSGELVDEDSPCEPSSEGGRICLEAEKLLRQHFQDQGSGDADESEGVVLRLAGIYGPGRLLRRVESVRRNEPVQGNPDAWLNLIHVEDAAGAVLVCAAMSAVGNEILLVCDGSHLTRREYYSHLAELLNAPSPEFVEADDSSPSRARTSGLNKRCSNLRLLELPDFKLRYPSARAGLEACLS